MKIYAVIDTNVVLSSLLSKKSDSASVMVMEAAFNGKITPLYHPEMLDEYEEVLHRPDFKLHDETINKIIAAIKQYGTEVFPNPTGETLADMDDLIFYEVAMEMRENNVYLVTFNTKHYPEKSFVITPAEMLCVLTDASLVPKRIGT
jgi:putative PIN family toxin of toxin-antitoxin system